MANQSYLYDTPRGILTLEECNAAGIYAPERQQVMIRIHPWRKPITYNSWVRSVDPDRLTAARIEAIGGDPQDIVDVYYQV